MKFERPSIGDNPIYPANAEIAKNAHEYLSGTLSAGREDSLGKEKGSCRFIL